MSNQLFPSNLPGMNVAVERETLYDFTTLTSPSGVEQRATWSSTPRYRYFLKFNLVRDDTAAPAPNAGYTETAIIQKFIDDHEGGWDSFLYIDPLSGVSTRVRFEQGSLRFKRIADHFWAIDSLVLISVK